MDGYPQGPRVGGPLAVFYLLRHPTPDAFDFSGPVLHDWFLRIGLFVVVTFNSLGNQCNGKRKIEENKTIYCYSLKYDIYSDNTGKAI